VTAAARWRALTAAAADCATCVAAAGTEEVAMMVIRVADERVYYFSHPTIIATCYDDHAEVVVLPEVGHDRTL
jgi:Trk K+ transport system NAD-binding subunit